MDITYSTMSGRDINNNRTECCDDSEHRPTGTRTWFCMSCGKTRPDTPKARKATK